MTDCPTCGATVTHGMTASGEKIPLDSIEEPTEGPGRYRIVQNGTPPTIEAITEDYPAPSPVDHREICERGRA